MKSKVILLFIVLVFVGFGSLLYPYLYPFFVEKEAKSELLDFQKIVFLGDSVYEFKSKFQGKNYRHLGLSGNPSYWICETPSQLGAKNWIMFFDLEGEKVRRIRVRTADNFETLPVGAPKDIQ